MASLTPDEKVNSWQNSGDIPNLSTLSISAATAAGPPSIPPTPTPADGVQIRGTNVRLDIPLDAEPPIRASGPRVSMNAQDHDQGAEPQSRTHVKLSRTPSQRDSLKRREALLRGKEGSRRRLRWENSYMLNNPWMQPPESHDWEIRPTYPVHREGVPYVLAGLWDEKKAALAAKEKEEKRIKIRNKGDVRGGVPRELKEKLKGARGAKGLLQDLEERIRGFVYLWEEKERELESKRDQKEETRKKRSGKRKPQKREEGKEWRARSYTLSSEEDGVLIDPPSPSQSSVSRSSVGTSGSSSDSDDEIVFVGRRGSPTKKEKQKRKEERDQLKRDQLVFDSLLDDHGASFGRWLVHSIAAYYNLSTWSVTTDDDPKRREAYVGIPEGRRCLVEAVDHDEFPRLPRPLWGMI